MIEAMMRRSCHLAILLLPGLILPPGLFSQDAASKKLSSVASTAQAGGCASFAAPAMGEGGGRADETSKRDFDTANLDRSIAPCDDFYKFADGGWIKNNPIPADHSSWATFNQLHDKNEDVLRAILEEASKDTSAKPGSNWQKIGDFYASCMNESQIESAGLEAARSGIRRRSATSRMWRACRRKSRIFSARALTSLSDSVPIRISRTARK